MNSKRVNALTDEQMQAVRRALTSFADAKERWAQLAARGAADDEIIAAMNREIGYGGGSGGPGLLHQYHRPNPPRIWFGIIPEGPPDVAGKQLVGLARRIFNIPPPGQLPLPIEKLDG